jgi:hypothetical protein
VTSLDLIPDISLQPNEKLARYADIPTGNEFEYRRLSGGLWRPKDGGASLQGDTAVIVRKRTIADPTDWLHKYVLHGRDIYVVRNDVMYDRSDLGQWEFATPQGTWIIKTKGELGPVPWQHPQIVRRRQP